ncbi:MULTISPECIES: Rid family detoxifying hydrolase [Acutalibacteraceae]|uniref:Rid family detoxifying hydrolase n=1 Tax=Acutalibacteraceae TaxID=3082771 RepID=UPI0013E8D754|nr:MULTISPECIES: Rid family detoxifying hydrolase [Acutalibacteraceae]
MFAKVSTSQAPGAIGPYSQAIKTEKSLYISGQTPVNPASGKIDADSVEQQAEQVMKNIGAILASQGMDYGNVVKTTCFLSDMKNFAAFNRVYGKYFTEKPARSCVAVKEIPLGALCEVEAIAVI